MNGSRDPDALLTRLAGAPGHPRALTAGEALFRTGARVHHLHLVMAGEIRLIRYPSPGQSVVLQIAAAGDLLAEASLFSSTYHCDALCAGDARVLAFECADVRRGLEADAEAAAAFSAHLARQVQQVRTRAALLAIRGAGERLVAYLDTLRQPGRDTVDPGRSWTAVASEIGLSHAAVYRALASLERTGRIERAGRTVTLVR